MAISLPIWERAYTYIKQRLFGIDRSFSEDHTCITFLFNIKEALEIKRSRVTYFRKAKTDKVRFSKEALMNLAKHEIARTTCSFEAFKNVRGTAPYFQQKKKELYAMIRQLGPPNLFFTKSNCEINLTSLLKSLLEKKSGHLVEEKDVEDMSTKDKCELLKNYPIDVSNT